MPITLTPVQAFIISCLYYMDSLTLIQRKLHKMQIPISFTSFKLFNESQIKAVLASLSSLLFHLSQSQN